MPAILLLSQNLLASLVDNFGTHYIKTVWWGGLGESAKLVVAMQRDRRDGLQTGHPTAWIALANTLRRQAAGILWGVGHTEAGLEGRSHLAGGRALQVIRHT